jgi:hypothetical protein
MMIPMILADGAKNAANQEDAERREGEGTEFPFLAGNRDGGGLLQAKR